MQGAPGHGGGAMMSGLREAIRMIDIMENRGDSMAEAEALAAAQRQSDSERNEVRHQQRRSWGFCRHYHKVIKIKVCFRSINRGCRLCR